MPDSIDNYKPRPVAAAPLRGGLIKIKGTMTQKTITIAGKQVGIAYCFATEIAFKALTGNNIEEADVTNPEQVVYLILAAISAYYQEQEAEAPVTDKDIIYRAKPKELIEALTAVLAMRADWYESPKGEATEEEPKDESKRKYRKPKNA